VNGLLVDTHVFLWALFEPEKLSEKTRRLITDPDRAFFVSSITFWEISLKFALGKLHLENCEPEQLEGRAKEMGLEILPLAADEAASFHRLPKLSHKDPFDRMLIWQAITRKLTLVSKDRAFTDYEEHGLTVVW